MAEPVTLFYTNFYNSPVGKIAILTMDNGRDYKKPSTFGEASMVSLGEALDRVVAEPGVKGLMLTGKPFVFAAGADLSQVALIDSFEKGYEIGKLGHSVMRRIPDLPFPSVAAINGVALGGGLEIALYCTYRTVAKNVQAIGLPECYLGLIPGWGGCTLGTKLIGPENALQLIVTNPLSRNRTLTGPQAFKMGLADRLLDGVEFLDDSLKFLMGVISGDVVVERRPWSADGLRELIDSTRAFVDASVHGAAPAPYKALELIETACSGDIDAGSEAENRALGEMIMTPQCKASMYSFDLVSRYAKKPKGAPDAKPLPVRKVGVVGAGLMASQLAQLFIHRLNVPVVMKDVRQDLVDRGMAYVRGEFRKLVEKGKIEEHRARHLSGLLKGTLDYGDFADCDFVIEAVFENMEVKKQVFAELEAVVRPDCILATNTSALSVTEMASGLDHPERVVGLHFFNPVAVLPLVEVVTTGLAGGRQPSPEAEGAEAGIAVATTLDVAGKLTKTAILVKDSPAFLVNRILVKMLVDCLAIVDEGADFRQVDDALLALGLPMAPFDLLGLVGPAVALHVMETLHQAFPERFPVSENMKRMVDAKVPGIYLPGSKPPRVIPELEAAWRRKENREFSPDEIRRRVLANLAREIDRILAEGVVNSSRDVDLAMIMGAGWPFFMGGITMYLDLSGISPKALHKTFFGK